MRIVMHIGLAACLALAAPAFGAKLDNSNSSGATTTDVVPAEEVSGPSYFAAKLPLTSAIVELEFALDYADITTAVEVAIAGSANDVARTTALVGALTRVAISYELKLLDAPGPALMDIVDLQADYVNALMQGDGAAVCAAAIFDGSGDLVGRGLWDKYSAQIDATMAAFFSAVTLALDSPSGIGAMTAEDGAAVVAQMTAQGDKALMDHFAVMTRESPENCPAVLAIIRAVKALEGEVGLRMVAAQARGASRL